MGPGQLAGSLASLPSAVHHPLSSPQEIKKKPGRGVGCDWEGWPVSDSHRGVKGTCFSLPSIPPEVTDIGPALGFEQDQAFYREWRQHCGMA